MMMVMMMLMMIMMVVIMVETLNCWTVSLSFLSCNDDDD